MGIYTAKKLMIMNRGHTEKMGEERGGENESCPPSWIRSSARGRTQLVCRDDR